jgi:hypothetical protein
MAPRAWGRSELGPPRPLEYAGLLSNCRLTLGALSLMRFSKPLLEILVHAGILESPAEHRNDLR